MLNKVKTYIGNTPWDEVMKTQEEKWLNKVCWGIILISALYIIPICLNTFYEVKHGTQITKAAYTETAKTIELQSFKTKDQKMELHKSAEQQSPCMHRLRGI